jgi:hypothetical protein
MKRAIVTGCAVILGALCSVGVSYAEDFEQTVLKGAEDCYYACMYAENCAAIQRDYSSGLLASGHTLAQTDYAAEKWNEACEMGKEDFFSHTKRIQELKREIESEMAGRGE